MCLCEQTDDGEVVDEDVAHLYQSRIAQQKAELEALVAQKKELLQLRDMLRQLQVQEAKVRIYVRTYVHTCTLCTECVPAYVGCNCSSIYACTVCFLVPWRVIINLGISNRVTCACVTTLWLKPSAL